MITSVGAAGASSSLHQRHGDVLVAQLPEGLDHRGAQQFIHEQGNETRRNRRRSDPAQCLHSRERQEEVSLLRNGDERLTGLRRMKTAKRLDDVKSHVGVGIAQTCNQRRNRAPVTTFAKNQRRLGTKIRVSVIEKTDERIDDVDIADGQQVQRTAEHAQIGMLLPKGLHQRLDDRVSLLRERRDGLPPDAPILDHRAAGSSTRSREEIERAPRPAVRKAPCA